MNSKALTALAACLFLLVSLSAARGDNSAAISGIVTDSETKAPIPGVSVRIEGTKLGAQTNTEGRFTIKDLKPGHYALKVTSVDYQSVRKEVDLATGETLDLAIELHRNVTDIGKEIVVTGTADVIDRYATENKVSLKSDQESALAFRPQAGGNYLTPTDKSNRMPPAKPNIYPSRPLPFEEYEGVPYDMFFRDYGTNGFIDTWRDRLSTFAVDVDDASFNVTKEYLGRGYLPPADAIRVEEFINHFDYGYNPPDNKKFRVFSEMIPSMFSEGTTVLKIGIKGAEIERSERRPVNLTFVIDVSGSMREGGRLELVKEALRMLVRQLRPSDRVALVAYGSTARIVLEPTDMRNPAAITRASQQVFG